MTTPFLRVNGVWKRFSLGNAHDSLRELIPQMVRSLTGRGSTDQQHHGKEFWALSDVSFEVQPGEVLGIIGANGAGKSTTLKILNRIMDPTIGRVDSVGRIGALIEVSAGFHQDLTGRQNVFLQGAIMGMRRREVESKFDAIVDFSGVEDFIDIPVKRYSNGMNARLGFAIAAHMSPEILIIDEVLAVGDHAFQSKAFNRIKELSRSGAPVVMVSHQLDKITSLCTKAIFLEKGAVRFAGDPFDCVREYLEPTHDVPPQATSGQPFQFNKVRVETEGPHFSGSFIELSVDATAEEGLSDQETIAIRFRNISSGALAFSVVGVDYGIDRISAGRITQRIRLQLNVKAGIYHLEVLLWNAGDNRDGLVGLRTRLEVVQRGRFWGSSQPNVEWLSE